MKTGGLSSNTQQDPPFNEPVPTCLAFSLGNDNCTECEMPLSAAWIGGLVVFTIAIIIIGAYYTVNMVYAARSTLIECSKMCVDMMVVFMQNLGVMNQILVGGLEFLFFLFFFNFSIWFKQFGDACF